MEEAILLLPERRKSAYLDAVERVPHLVATESPPIRFLRFYGDASEAAHHLCSYWESRKAIFGKRAFLPMNQTGNGALDEDDLVNLDLGSFAFLPNNVLFYDPSTYVSISEQSKQRLSFYLWSILSENEESQKHGFVVVVPLGPTSCGPNFKVFEEAVFRAIPVRIKLVHLLCCPGRAELRAFCAKFLPKTLREMANLLGKKEIIRVAVAEKFKDFANVMATRGLPKFLLPEAFGGTLALRQCFLYWKRERLVSESGRYTNIVALRAGVLSQEEQRSTPTASSCSVSSWSVSNPAIYIAASRTPEHPGLDESVHSEVCSTMEGPLSDSTGIPTSKPRLSAVHAVQEGKSDRERHLGDAKEYRNNAVYDSLPKLNMGLREWEEALMAIPPEERQAYSEALERAPHLVKTEPGPLSFLRTEKFDVCAAARRAVRFWTLRKNIFGDRAYLPMNQTGEGALSREELEILGTGFTMHSGRDSQGQSILVALTSRLKINKTYELFEKMERICFYFACVACEDNGMTHKHGLVFIRVVDPLIYRGQLKHVARIFSTCCGPFTLHSVIQGPCEPGFIQALAQPNVLGEGNVRQHYIHTGESVGEVLAKLRSHGISEKSLPPTVGGPWTVEKFECWCRERVAIERERADGISTHTSYAGPKKRQAGNTHTNACIGEDDLKDLSGGMASFKEPKLTADSRPGGMGKQPFQGYDGKKGCLSGEDGAL